MSSQARKPYLNLKESLIQFFSAPTRYLKTSNQQESVFEKPYWDGEYPSMHLDIPVLDWGGWDFDDDVRIRPGGRRRPGGGGAVPVQGCPGCALYADPSSDCVTDPVELHSGIYCTFTPGAATGKVLTAKQKVHELDTSGWGITSKTIGIPYGVQAGDTTLEAYAAIGSIKQITIGAWASLGPSAAVWVDPAVAEHRICGRMVDGAGSVCVACVDVSCCGCDNPPSAFQIDSYDSTINPIGTAFITVSGGCGPYKFTVAGNGYSISGSGVTGTLNGLYGTCGNGANQTGAYATVTVTDACGTNKSCIIRNLDGVWSEQCTYGTAGCGYDEPSGCISCGESEHWVYEGINAWKAFSYACRNAGCNWGTYGSCVAMGAPTPAGDCSTPYV